MPRIELNTSGKGTPTFKLFHRILGCVLGTSARFHRLRHENLKRFKKIEQKRLLGGFWGQNENHKLKIFEIEKFSEISKNFHWKLYENEKFWDRKFLIFFDLKIFRMPISSCSNFFRFQHFVLIFFIDRCKICPRSRFIYAKSAENATGKS